MTDNPRWTASIHYRLDNGLIHGVEHDLHELSEVHDLVERGPHFDCIVGIGIRRINHCTSPTLTVEEAVKI